MTKVNCSDQTCTYNKNNECQRDEIYVGLFVTAKNNGKANIMNLCKCYEKKGEKRK